MGGNPQVAALAQVVPATHGNEFQKETISVVLPEEHSFVTWREQKRRWGGRLGTFDGEALEGAAGALMGGPPAVSAVTGLVHPGCHAASGMGRPRQRMPFPPRMRARSLR